MDPFDKNSRVAALQRRRGASPEAVANLRASNQKETDWYTVCRKCGAKLEGSLSNLKEHSCG